MPIYKLPTILDSHSSPMTNTTPTQSQKNNKIKYSNLLSSHHHRLRLTLLNLDGTTWPFTTMARLSLFLIKACFPINLFVYLSINNPPQYSLASIHLFHPTVLLQLTKFLNQLYVIRRSRWTSMSTSRAILNQ